MNKLKPTYKKIIPLDKFQKIFYPRRYIQVQSKYFSRKSLHPILDHKSLLKKDNRINSIYNNETPIKNHFELTTSSLNKTNLLLTKLLKTAKKKFTSNDFHKRLDPFNTNNKEERGYLDIRSCKKQNDKRLSVTDIGDYKHIGIQLDSHNDSNQAVNKVSIAIKSIKNKSLQQLGEVIKHIVEKHTPVISTTGVTNYRKAFRKNAELFDLKGLNKTQTTLNPSINNEVKTYTDNNLNKLFKKKVNDRVIPLMLRKKIQSNNVQVGTEIRNRIKSYTVKKRSTYGNIKVAIKEYPSNYMSLIKPTRNLSLNMEETDTSKYELCPKPETIGSIQKITRNIIRIKELMKSIDIADKEINSYTINIQNFTKTFQFNKYSSIFK